MYKESTRQMHDRMLDARVVVVLVLGACVLSTKLNANSIKCDSKCICERNGTEVIVTCTNINLRSLHNVQIPEDVTVLRVGGNKIRDIPNGSLQRFSKLRELDLSSMIDAKDHSFTIYSNSFRGLQSLKVLNMEKVAEYLDFSCKSRPFRHLQSLLELNMLKVRARSPSCLNMAFYDLRQLTRLSLRIVKHHIPLSLALMENVTVLDLTESEFQSMDQETFSALSNISVKVLSLRKVQFETVDPLALLPVAHSLQALDYSCPFTKNRNPNLFAPILPSFENSTVLRVLNLDSVYEHTDECLKLQDKQFKSLHQVPLVSLSIRDNSLTTVRRFWRHIRSVKYLNMNYNPLNTQYIHKSEELLLGLMQRNSFQTLMVSYLTQSNSPSTCSSDVNLEFWKQLKIAKQLQQDDDKENLIMVDSVNVGATLKLKIHVEDLTVSHIDFLNLNAIQGGPVNISNFYCGPQLTCSLDVNSLTRLDISYINWNRFEWPIYGLNGVKHLNLEHANLEYVHPGLFRAVPSLQTLLLAVNRIGLFTNETELVAIFSNLQNIKEIDLTDNMLTTIPKVMFSNCTSLVILNLQKNPLLTFELDFSLFPGFTFIDLSNCEIQEFKYFQTAFFKTSSTFGRHVVNVSGLSELSCQNCNNKEFYDMIRNNKSLVDLEGREELTCTHGTERIKLVDLDLSSLEFSCWYETFLIVCVTLTSVVIIGVVVVLYCRWNIKYLVYLTKNKLRKRGNPNANIFEYDLYISFSEDDRDIAFQLFTGLHNKGLDVFFWPRNSRPGSCVFDEIFEQLDGSKKVLVLVTSSTENSVTQNFEIRMSMARGKGFIIPVVTEDFVVCNLPQGIKHLLRHDLYFLWPEEDEEKEEFWKNLERAITTKRGVQFRRNGCVAYYGK